MIKILALIAASALIIIYLIYLIYLIIRIFVVWKANFVPISLSDDTRNFVTGLDHHIPFFESIITSIQVPKQILEK